MKIILFFSVFILCSCATNKEFASFRIGADIFNTSEGVFERMLCYDNQSEVKVRINLDEESKAEILKLAQIDISEGNEELSNLEKICVGSYPFEISITKDDSTTSTTCLSLLNGDESQFANFVYSLQEVQDLPNQIVGFISNVT